MSPAQPVLLNDQPLWYKDAVIYQIHVRAFCDSNGDGIGDLRGVISKLDYLQSLGVNALWLLPFYPSPLKDDGYDISDFVNVHPSYGTLEDFSELVEQAHERGIRIITELVLNHTSDQHHWFQQSRQAKPSSLWRDFYVWSERNDRYEGTSVLYKDFMDSNWSWDSQAKAYYWHRFFPHQPDLNYDNPEVRQEILRVVDFWLERGVDGLRLDAIPYLFEKEGTNCENLPETHRFLKELRSHVDSKFSNRALFAEANQWPEDAASYFGNGDECNVVFHFPVEPRLYMALHKEDTDPILDILEQTPNIPSQGQWAMFLRNHDELALDLITDEERSYMIQAYAKDPQTRLNQGIRRRLAPLLNNDRRKIELLNILLFSLPGVPVVYYGDEIGMGDNIYLPDRNGIRTPMQWNSDRNGGFSQANPQRLYSPIITDPEYHYKTINVELQQSNPSSLLKWMSNVIATRKKYDSFGRGKIKFHECTNNKVLAFTRELEDEKILVLANLSQSAQVAEIELEDYAGCFPEEIFSHIQLPEVKKTPYSITLAPYGYYWAFLHKGEQPTPKAGAQLVLRYRPDEEFWQSSKNEDFLKRDLPSYLVGCRWFGGKARRISKMSVVDRVPMPLSVEDEHPVQLLFIQVSYLEGLPDTVILPVQFTENSDEAQTILNQSPEGVIARFETAEHSGLLFDASFDPVYRTKLLELMAGNQTLSGPNGTLSGRASKELEQMYRSGKLPRLSKPFRVEQSNTSINYEDKFFLKFYRQLQTGINPDTEVPMYLTEGGRFKHVPSFVGMVSYQRLDGTSSSIALLQNFTSNQGDAWSMTLDVVSRYYDKVIDHSQNQMLPELGEDEDDSTAKKRKTRKEGIPSVIKRLMDGEYLENIGLLGQRTGEMHLALGRDTDDADFLPEPYSPNYHRTVYQESRRWMRISMKLLQKRMSVLPPEVKKEAQRCLDMQDAITKVQKAALGHHFEGCKTRIHGDYHLGQILFTGKDFVIIDFEGEPARPVNERRIKKSCLRDVAGMLRSFHYAAYNALLQGKNIKPKDRLYLENYADLWYDHAVQTFLKEYLEVVKGASFFPESIEDIDLSLKIFVLDKALYELVYELNNRPTWVMIPLKGIMHLAKENASYLKR